MSWTLSGDRDDLIASFEVAERFVGKNNLTGIHVRKLMDEQYVEASDQTMSLRTHLWGSFDTDQVDAVLHPKVVKALKALAKGDVTLTKSDDAGSVEVRGSGKSRYEVPVEAREYPQVFPGANKVEWQDVVAVDAKDAIEAMARCGRYVSKKDSNPSITGVNLRVLDGTLMVESTDSQRAYQERVPLPAQGFPFGEAEVILPVRMINELVRLFPSGEVKLTADTHRFFAKDANDATLFMSQRIGGKYPELDKIADEADYKAGFTVDRKEMLDALERIEGMVGSRPVRLEVADGEAVLTSRDEGNSAEEHVAAKTGSEPVTIGFNVTHLASGFEAFSGDVTTMRYVSPLRPAVLTSDGEKRRFVLIPVRV